MSDFDRRVGIGASEAGAVLGLSPFATPTDVWLSKMSPEPVTLGGPDMTPAQEWGHRLEGPILDKYEDETETGVQRLVPTKLHATVPVFATPDGLVFDGDEVPSGLVDAKCTNHDEGWGEQYTDEIPEHYLVQGVIQMAVRDKPWVDFAVLFLSRRRFGIWRVERDLELEAVVLERLAGWWAAHVETREPPDPSDHTYLKQLPSNGRLLAPNNIFGDLALNDLRYAQRQHEKAKAIYEERKLEVQQHIGDYDGIESPGLGKVTWKTSKKTGRRTFRTTWED